MYPQNDISIESRSNFESNLDFTINYNSTFELGITKFSSLTSDEFRKDFIELKSQKEAKCFRRSNYRNRD